MTWYTDLGSDSYFLDLGSISTPQAMVFILFIFRLRMRTSCFACGCGYTVQIRIWARTV